MQKRGLRGCSLVSDGAVVLDTAYFRHVTFKNVEIVYRGGPVVLEDVYFVNCRFIMLGEDNSRRFGSQVLASLQVTFKAPGTQI
jgi:hypothetical protein